MPSEPSLFEDFLSLSVSFFGQEYVSAFGHQIHNPCIIPICTITVPTKAHKCIEFGVFTQ
jgi:hypothetical protein